MNLSIYSFSILSSRLRQSHSRSGTESPAIPSRSRVFADGSNRVFHGVPPPCTSRLPFLSVLMRHRPRVLICKLGRLDGVWIDHLLIRLSKAQMLLIPLTTMKPITDYRRNMEKRHLFSKCRHFSLLGYVQRIASACICFSFWSGQRFNLLSSTSNVLMDYTRLIVSSI